MEFGESAKAASWQNFTSTNQPTVDNGGLSVPIGGNALIAACEDPSDAGYYDLMVLGESSNSKGHHLSVMEPATFGNPGYEWSGSSEYYKGISISSGGLPLYPQWFGWTGVGGLYENNTSLGIGPGISQGVATSAWYGRIFVLEDAQCAAGGNPHGNCVSTDIVAYGYLGSMNGSPGAAQITDDGVSSLSELIYAVDNAGAVWTYSLSSGNWQSLPMNLCGGSGSLVAGQIAVTNNTIFALQETKPNPGGHAGGAVYQYLTDRCWSKISPLAAFLSIAPMNQAAFADTSIYLWATDILGEIYYYHD
jgi:hypothetical protein